MPKSHPETLEPRLTVPAAIALEADVHVPQPDTDKLGSPFSLLMNRPPSFGTGGPNGVGEGKGDGVGNREGSGVGGTGLGPVAGSLRGGSTRPILVHKVEPEYSDDARKVKLQGLVVLAASVGIDGRLKDIRVVRQLGLGLDEKAVQAAELWLFRPAMADGLPIASNIMIEVAFHLL